MSLPERAAWLWSRLEAPVRLFALGAAPLNVAVAGALMETLEPAAWVCVRRVERDSGGLIEPTLTSALSASLSTQEQDLLQLEPGWDGYGAAPLEPAVVKELVDELRESLKGISANAPQLVPGGDGSLQAEWYLPGLEIFYQLNRDRDRFLFVAAADGDHVYAGADAQKSFPAIVRTLRAFDDNTQANGTGPNGTLV